MNPVLRFVLLAAVLLPLQVLGGCRSAARLLVEPAPTDPLDGYEGILPRAGIQTELDYGPKQELLLSKFTALTETNTKLVDRCRELEEKNNSLLSQLGKEGSELAKERALRAQAEAETEQLRQRRRDLEARILSLSIEKAKLEQATLTTRIQALSASLEEINSSAMEAAAPPPRNR